VSPEYRVLLYPHRHGDPLPTTAWNDDRSELTLSLGKQVDRYRFAQADGGRTVFRMERADQTLISGTTPARPVALIGGQRLDPNAARQTREDGKPFTRRFAESLDITLERPAPPAVLRYTTDGSDPTATSPAYDGPITVTTTTTLTVRCFDPTWTAGPTVSAPTVITALRNEPLAGAATAPSGSRPGLWTRLYELDTNPWDDRGFFRANQVLMPRLDDLKPTASVFGRGITVPHAAPTRPLSEQAKGFYRWTGWFHAAKAGTYTFAMDSCGPVTLDVGPRGVIDHTGHFHQQQAVRRGEVVLGAGWHPIDLAVCDPQFWNAMTLGLMPVGLTVAVDDGPAAAPAAEAWACAPQGALDQEPTIPHRDGSTDLPTMEPGLSLASYLREVPMTDPAFLDIDDLTPRRTELVTDLADNVRPGQVRVYEGWIHIPRAGVHTFTVPRRRDGHAGLNELRAAYQNQLRIDGEVVVQQGVPGRMPLGRISLGAGWHHLSLRLGSSPGKVVIGWPDGSTTDLVGSWWSRPRSVGIRPAGQTAQRTRYEIFGPTEVRLDLPDLAGAVIRATTDGTVPTATTPVAPATLTIDRDMVIAALAFQDGRPVTAPKAVTFVRTTLPKEGLMTAVGPDLWARLPAEAGGVHDLPGGLQAIIPSGSTVVDGALRLTWAETIGKPLVDINLAKGGPKGLRLNGLRMPDHALTVALRVRTGDSGRLFGREGINAYGKGIKTLGLRLDKGRVVAEPGRLRSTAPVAPGWRTFVMSIDDRQSVVWVDGQELLRGTGSSTLITDSLDLLAENSGDIGWARVYDRVLEPSEVAVLAAAP
jgi:hypothetical protein